MKRKKSTGCSASWPTFMAWCPEDQRFEALTATLIALVGEEGTCRVSRRSPGDPDDEDYVYIPQPTYFVPPREAVEVIRPDYTIYGIVSATPSDFRASSGRELWVSAEARHDRKLTFLPGYPTLEVSISNKPVNEFRLAPDSIVRFKGIETPMDLQAGVAWLMTVSDIQNLLKRFCTSHPAITMGCCLDGPEWGAPLTGAASYHADGYPGRDLALSWIHLHDKDPLDLAVGWTIDALRERVEASPKNSSISIVNDECLLREYVLAALDIPRKTLVEALEAAAAERDPKWEAIERELGRLLDQIREVVRNPDARYLAEMVPVTEEHIKLIEEYSPAYVEHLENNALMLYAHPDRTLWPLWSSALDLLGIRPTVAAPNQHKRAHDPKLASRHPPARSISEWSSGGSLDLNTPNVNVWEPESDRDVICRRQPCPDFVVWYRDIDPIDAWSTTVSALAGESVICSMWDATEEAPRTSFKVPLTDARALLHREPERYWASTGFLFEAPSGRVMPTWSSFSKSRSRYKWFFFNCGNCGNFFPTEIPHLKRDRPYSPHVEAGLVWQVAVQDCHELLMRLCRSSPAITSGGCMEAFDCGVALTNGATYNADGYPGRDIALSWLHRYDPYDETIDAGWSIDALRERIEAAPAGARARILDPEDQLTREHVLAALALPPKELIAALEAAAARIDPAWKAIEAECTRVLGELEKAEDGDVETIPLNGDHIRFIQDHSPASVEHLDNGAIVLFAHPYRTLWPLWADALALLGIRPLTT